MAKELRDVSQAGKTMRASAGWRDVSMPSSRAEGLFAQSGAGRWGLSAQKFSAALQRSAERSLASGALATEKIDEYLRSLHLEDLALATACLENSEAAWEHFVAEYRNYLRAAAAAILRCRAGAREASDLADSLFTELYGLADGPGRERSLFRYFHGRSSLKTWLRAVLAQRHIDMIRAGRRFESLDDDASPSAAANMPTRVSPHPTDPHRERYVALFVRALQAALTALEARDGQRLRLYYAKELTLAEIGRQLGEHESSVSRNLDRIRLLLRRAIEQTLRDGAPSANGMACDAGLSDAQIALCFEYAAADTPFDLEQLLERRRPASPTQGESEL